MKSIKSNAVTQQYAINMIAAVSSILSIVKYDASLDIVKPIVKHSVYSVPFW